MTDGEMNAFSHLWGGFMELLKIVRQTRTNRNCYSFILRTVFLFRSMVWSKESIYTECVCMWGWGAPTDLTLFWIYFAFIPDVRFTFWYVTQLSLHLSVRRANTHSFVLYKNLYTFPDREIYTGTIIIIQFYTQCLAEVFMRLQFFFTFCQVTSRDVRRCWAVMWQRVVNVCGGKPKGYTVALCFAPSIFPSSFHVHAGAVANRWYGYLQADVQRPFFFLPPHMA